ncbi:unnamed protein product [Caenorhabditis bovis]|uniref:Uncharacterized protein n=1 Tax=Caenorhabditis bovis TaxID=2654633 RepID=A0A8S1EIR9_9PELO|nr:unnamed protein product [Caenorhabditis bovis]
MPEKFPRKQSRKPSGERRQSNSWDNDLKNMNLTLPDVESRRNSHTFAKLLECSRQLSMNTDGNESDDSSLPIKPPSIQTSRRTSIAEISDKGIVTKNSDDCVVLTQTLGTSTTYFFQKDPDAENLSLRPSVVERGLYNFDDVIKEAPKRAHDTPRPSIALNLKHSIAVYEPPRGRQLQKAPKKPPPFGNELDQIILNRRKILEEEESKRELQNLIQPRKETSHRPSKPHNFDGRLPSATKTGIMEELRTQIESGQIDRVVKEKKTTTVTETREIVYFTQRLPASIAISTRLSPTGVPVNVPNRNSITDSIPPPILERPYVRASNHDGKIHGKNVTIRLPDDGQNSGGHPHCIRRSPQNVRPLTTYEKIALRLNAAKYEAPTNHPLDNVADNCRQC